ncbi:hypothetical protein HDV05_006337 [Chytridiales sp. JEL 0842]|nr:hypothetical protein HDV05_006337 [Chytridiales sp. JEL 0842]
MEEPLASQAFFDEHAANMANSTAVPNSSPTTTMPYSNTVTSAPNSVRTSGTVKFFNSQKGYGFIIPQEGELEVFVHHTAILKPDGGFRSLAEGEQVEFDLIHGPKGLQAANVSGPNGTQVKGDPQANMHGATSPKIQAGNRFSHQPAYVPFYNKETDQTSFVYAGPSQGLSPAPAYAMSPGGYYVPAQWAAFPGAVAYSPYGPAVPQATTGQIQQQQQATPSSPNSQTQSNGVPQQQANTTGASSNPSTAPNGYVFSHLGAAPMVPLVAPAATPESADLQTPLNGPPISHPHMHQHPAQFGTSPPASGPTFYAPYYAAPAFRNLQQQSHQPR